MVTIIKQGATKKSIEEKQNKIKPKKRLKAKNITLIVLEKSR
jgi:hypothetical protein